MVFQYGRDHLNDSVKEKEVRRDVKFRKVSLTEISIKHKKWMQSSKNFSAGTHL